MSDTVVTYVLWDEYEVKVGRTQAWRVEKRRRVLQTGNPHTLRVIALCDRDVETEVKTALRPWRLNSGPGREWFSTPDCARELSNQLVIHEFGFQPDWDLFQKTCLANRQMRRAGGALPERLIKASSRAYEKTALDRVAKASSLVRRWAEKMLVVSQAGRMGLLTESAGWFQDAEKMLEKMIDDLDEIDAMELTAQSEARWERLLAIMSYQEARDE